VVNVSWNDSVAFCDWLSQKEGKKYRLPTEAEWEYACRGGTTTRYWFGEDFEKLADHDNVGDQTAKDRFKNWSYHIKSRDGFAFTAPVGSYRRPNPFGLHDMHGNVVEWCADWYDQKYYARSPTSDPPGPVDGAFRVRRGGGLDYGAFEAESNSRHDGGECDGRSYSTGFRVVCEVE
jgi:formylglycine-generating enzyme required for sulfatase activity